VTEEGTVSPPSVVRRVKLTIQNTSGGRYQVFQRVNAPWTTPSGATFPLEAVRFFVSETVPKGDVRLPNPIPLEMRDQELYISDSAGSSTELIITYIVQTPVEQSAGEYHTTLSYRVVAQ
jgi:hypothetical protein